MVSFISCLQLVQAKDEELTRLRDELKHVKQSYDDISNFCEESITAASMLEQKATDLKVCHTDIDLDFDIRV